MRQFKITRNSDNLKNQISTTMCVNSSKKGYFYIPKKHQKWWMERNDNNITRILRIKALLPEFNNLQAHLQ